MKKYLQNIDEDYIFDEKIASIINACLKHNSSLLISGLHGSGKSSHIEQVCAIAKYPVMRINMDYAIDRSDLVGRDVVIVDKQTNNTITKFQEGILVWAIQQPMALILDEIDLANYDVLLVLQKILEKHNFALIEENKTIKIHKDFRLFATMNTKGQGDEVGIYHGSNAINQAHIDRWDMFLQFNSLKSSDISSLLKNKFCLY